MKKNIAYSIGIVSLLMAGHALASSAILTIAPSVTTITTASNAETSVIYTVTNNAKLPVTN